MRNLIILIVVVVLVCVALFVVPFYCTYLNLDMLTVHKCMTVWQYVFIKLVENGYVR